MRQRLAEISTYMDSTREALLDTVGDAGSAFASVRPTPDSWSVAQILAHLALVEAGIARLVSSSVQWARANGIGAETADDSILDCLDQFAIVTPAQKRKAPAVVDVGEEANIDDALKSLQTSRQIMHQALADADGLDLGSVVRPHPGLGDLNLYQWVLFVAQHEERHRRQIEQTLRDVSSRAAECAPIV